MAFLFSSALPQWARSISPPPLAAVLGLQRPQMLRMCALLAKIYILFDAMLVRGLHLEEENGPNDPGECHGIGLDLFELLGELRELALGEASALVERECRRSCRRDSLAGGVDGEPSDAGRGGPEGVGGHLQFSSGNVDLEVRQDVLSA